MKMNPITYSKQGDTAVIGIDNPPINATSRAVRVGLLEALTKAEKDNVSHGIIVCEGRTFVAGGDITEFARPPQEPHLPDVYQRFEDSPICWLAAMHGTVLGGGFELAMACDFRIASATTRFGLPEVNLGLIPGAGGTQRLPRLVGAALAIEMCCNARQLNASELLEAGGLDAIVDEPLIDSAHHFFTTPSASSTATPVSRRPVSPVDNDFFKRQRNAITRSARGAEAPLYNLEAIEWAVDMPFETAQPKERSRHLALRDSSQSIALRHVFFAERAAAKPAALKGVTPRTLNNIAIVGGGLMGSGIAAACLTAGLHVRMIETNPDTGIANVERLLQGALKRNKITEADYGKCLSQFQCCDDYKQLNNIDIAIEAVFEDRDVKRTVFTSLAAQLGSDTILATNTSYLDPVELSSHVENPARILGLHFFSPAHIMKLLEVVQTPHTSAEVLATGLALGKRLKKIAVLAGVCDGFIGNRMLAAYRRQADYLLADGAYPEQIDRAMRTFGMPMGPYELQDLTGLQIGYLNRQRQAATRHPDERYVSIADQLCEEKRFGQRTGAGWYRYEEGSREPLTDPVVNEKINRYSEQHGISRQSFNDDEIQQRLLAVLANEGQRILDEGIAASAADIDLVKIHGYGFPRWTGGPMHYAALYDTGHWRDVLQRVSEQSPNSWVLADAYR
jgi:3-hydroxyacyl-CoA dehydrogenase